MSDDVKFFETPAELRKCFESNLDKFEEQWIGLWKKSNRMSMRSMAGSGQYCVVFCSDAVHVGFWEFDKAILADLAINNNHCY